MSVLNSSLFRIRAMSVAGPVAEWALPAHEASVPELRSAVQAFAAAQGADRALLTDLALAVSEAVTNAVIHAFFDREPGTVRVCASAGVDEVLVVVADDGRGMQPRPDSPGLGMGLPLIGQLTAHFDIRVPEGGGTELSMTFAAPGVRGQGGALDVDRLLDDVSRTAVGAWPGDGVARLVDLLVPAVADACAVDVVDEAGHPQRFAGRIDGPDGERQSAWLAGLRPRVDAGSATSDALANGGVRLAELTPEHVAAVTTNPEDAAAMTATGIRWWAVASLHRGDRLLGLLHLGTRPSRGKPLPEWLDLVAAIADRAAGGLAGARLVAELDRTRRRFEGILDVLAEAVAVIGADGRLVYANDAAVRLFGASSALELTRAAPGELLARLAFTHPDGTTVERSELPGYHAISGETPAPLLVRSRDPADGSVRWLLIKATVLDDEEKLAVNVIEDVTPGHQAS
jgi:serine/threonine-protein kinase RsbW/stage II sporulation protein AB (anti-sigma F factor)